MYPRVNPDALPSPGSSLEMGHAVPYPPPLPPEEVLPVPVIQQRRHGGDAPDRNSCEDHDPSALLVAATLITMLAFLLGSSVPGGYWPQDTPSGDGSGSRLYRAGDSIMRDLHRPRYWVFRVASWAGVASSMVLTLSLLVRMAVASRHVRWSFAVAYASLLLTFAASKTMTHLSLDILLCLAVLLVSWLITSVREENRACVMKVLFCSSSNRDS